ncbi:MAG: hypothetical protein AAF483_23690 [Planctomycetota bacterium]
MSMLSEYEEGMISISELLFTLLLNENEAELDSALSRVKGIDAAYCRIWAFDVHRGDKVLMGSRGIATISYESQAVQNLLADYATALRERFAGFKLVGCPNSFMDETNAAMASEATNNFVFGTVVGCFMSSSSKAAQICFRRVLEDLYTAEIDQAKVVRSKYLGMSYRELEAEFDDSLRIGVAARDYLDLGGEPDVAARLLHGFIVGKHSRE